MKTALITGVTGQDGSYLSELLLEKGYTVHGVVRRSSTESFERISHLSGRIQLHQADLLDQLSIIDVIKETAPDEVYNLAAMSFVPTSWKQPVLTGGIHRHWGYADAGSNPPSRKAHDQVLPGVLQRDVWESGGGSPEGKYAVLSSKPLRGRQGLRTLDYRELSRELQHVLL